MFICFILYTIYHLSIPLAIPIGRRVWCLWFGYIFPFCLNIYSILFSSPYLTWNSLSLPDTYKRALSDLPPNTQNCSQIITHREQSPATHAAIPLLFVFWPVNLAPDFAFALFPVRYASNIHLVHPSNPNFFAIFSLIHFWIGIFEFVGIFRFRKS